MVINSQIRKVVLRCVTPNRNVITRHYIARSGKLARILSCMQLNWCHSFAKNTFLRRLVLGEVNKLRFLVRIFHTQNLSLIECLGMAGSEMADCS